MTIRADASSPVSASASTEERRRLPVLLVTGMSGAGRSSALKTLEDMGYEAVDNLPLSLLSNLLRIEEGYHQPLAIGTDIRSRDFGVAAFLGKLDSLIARDDLDVRILFLDCDDEILGRRYTETRRRHPLAEDRPLMDGIAHERHLLAGLRDRADVVLDTSHLTLNDLRRILNKRFAVKAEAGPTISVTSFSFRKGLPREADLVFDARFLDNPHYVTELRPLTGLDPRVGAHVAADPDWEVFFAGLTGLLSPLLPRFHREGKSYLTIAVGCTGGRHRSVFTAEKLAAWLRDKGQHVTVSHRELEKFSQK